MSQNKNDTQESPIQYQIKHIQILLIWMTNQPTITTYKQTDKGDNITSVDETQNIVSNPKKIISYFQYHLKMIHRQQERTSPDPSQV